MDNIHTITTEQWDEVNERLSDLEEFNYYTTLLRTPPSAFNQIFGRELTPSEIEFIGKSAMESAMEILTTWRDRHFSWDKLFGEQSTKQ